MCSCPYRPACRAQSLGVYTLVPNEPDGAPVGDDVLDAFIAGTRRDTDAGEFLRRHQVR
jgi:hypothetical protein